MGLSKNDIRSFLARRGTFIGFLSLALFPVTLAITMPVKLAMSIWHWRKIFTEERGSFLSFSGSTGLNNLFYWTRALNYSRFGRYGKSPYFGLGEPYPLTRGFHYSLTSLFAYWKAPIATVITATFGWLLSHFVWTGQSEVTWLIVILLVTLISTTFYASIIFQNYNALGWLFFPLFLYGLYTGNWLFAGIGGFMSGLFSITVGVVCGIFSLAGVIHYSSIYPLLAIIPTGLKMATHLFPLLKERKELAVIPNLLKALGFVRHNVTYIRRGNVTDKILYTYLFLAYTGYAVALFFISGIIDIFIVTGIGIFLLNIFIGRFADRQSVYLMMLTVLIASIIQNGTDYLLLPLFWLAISPPPVLLRINDSRNLDIVRSAKPFHVRIYIDKMKDFLAAVGKGESVLMAFDDPNGIYNELFNGYRALMELPHYVATLSEIRFMPDFWSVMRYADEDHPDFWGRDLQSVKRNLQSWKADFVIIYQDSGTELDRTWTDEHFEVCAALDWQELHDNLKLEKFYTPPVPRWWLLRVPDKLMPQ
jgi:hypothetical protein